MSNYDSETSDINYQIAIERQEMTLFSMLKPSIRFDGDQWCVLYGDNIAGFGSSPNSAVLDWNAKWYKQCSKIPEIPGFEGTRKSVQKLGK